MAKEYNIAFIDWQNLHLGTSNENWKIDFRKFRVYLNDKYNVKEVYFFLGFLSEDEQDLYTKLQKSWYILVFREHSSEMKWKKKWNVDVDIVFEIMKRIIEEKSRVFSKCRKWGRIPTQYSSSGVEKFSIRSPSTHAPRSNNKKYSSLYKQIDTKYRNNLSLDYIKNKIEYKKK